jgi:hypothetical protein
MAICDYSSGFRLSGVGNEGRKQQLYPGCMQPDARRGVDEQGSQLLIAVALSGAA